MYRSVESSKKFDPSPHQVPTACFTVFNYICIVVLILVFICDNNIIIYYIDSMTYVYN